MDKRAALLTLFDIVKFVIGAALTIAVALGVGYLLLTLPLIVAKVFVFTIPDDTPAAIVYGIEFLVLVFGGIAVCTIRETYLGYKEENKEE